jgi:heme exporter protein B
MARVPTTAPPGPQAGRNPLLQVESVSAFRGERLVLHDLSFQVDAGGALLLAGPNGAGKSTLLRALAGLVRVEAGRVLWRGEDALADLAGHGTRVAYVGHLDAIKPGLTVAENLAFAARISGLPVRPALEAVGLSHLEEVPGRMLSAGQRRRLALARLALSRAPIWLLDEPTLGLDRASVARFGRMLATHRAAGGIVVAATHLPLPLEGAATLDLGDAQTLTRQPAAADLSRPAGELDAPPSSLILPLPLAGEVARAPVRAGEGTGGSPMLALLTRELRLALRHASDSVAALLFFFVAASLFPLGIGPSPDTLGRIAPGIVWVCALLAALLPLDRLFGADADDGSLDQLLLSGLPAAGVAAAKAASHWITTGLPLLIAAIPGAVMLRMPDAALWVLAAGLLPGTLLLSLLGTTGAAVVLGARRGAVLLPLLILPLMVPVLIFGAAAPDAITAGLSARANLLWLAALLAAALPLCPLAAGAALRAAAE